MANFTAFDGQTFYGVGPHAVQVEGLRADIRHGTRLGQAYSYIVFCDEEGDKWKIVPTTFGKHGHAKGRPGSLRLYHRNRIGRRGMHSQRQVVWGTRSGLQDLVEYVRRHEQYEAEGVSGDDFHSDVSVNTRER